ncbi:MAG TPA: hypothetical protein VHL11_06600, partial [Phototrophicaceae bacterium]|nr:hypothetical protein [Phototrophicaceae bacterium]
PVVINPSPAIGDTGQNGLGVMFTTAPAAATGAQTAPGNIRLLGPRQRCVQRINIPASQLGSMGVTSIIKAYYRNSNQGFSGGTVGAIYADWGLWVGVVESDPVTLTFSAGT